MRPTVLDVKDRAVAKKWIQGAIEHPGALRKKAESAGESTRQFAESHKGDSGRTGSQSRLALTLMGMHGDKKARRAKLYDKSK